MGRDMLKEIWERHYAELRELHPAAYKKAVEYADGIAINYRLPSIQAAEIERAMVMLALEIVKPSQEQP